MQCDSPGDTAPAGAGNQHCLRLSLGFRVVFLVSTVTCLEGPPQLQQGVQMKQ